MTKNEFILSRMRSEHRTYRISVPILIACVVAAVVLTIVAFVMGKSPMSIGSTLIMISIAAQIPAMIGQRDAYGRAVEEFERHLQDPSAELSESTENLIDRFENRSVSELRQMVIAFSLIGLMLLGMGIFLFVILGSMSEGSILLEVILPALMAGGGVFLCVLAFRAFRDMKIARDLQALDAED